MIDFRYHLVSLVSVFLALAVGIVLGAGPLKDSISDTLSGQVEKLRQEKDALRTNLDTANTGVTHRDDFITDVSPALIAGQLTGRQVVVVTLPGSDGDDIKPLTDAITAAGGTVTGQVDVHSAWTDPTKATDRSALAAKLAETVPAGSGGGSAAVGDTGTQLARFLSDALLSQTGGGRGSTDSANVRESLKNEDLIGIKGDLSGLAGSALVLAPPNEAAVSGNVKPTADTTGDDAYLALASALDNAGGGAVVTGPSSSAIGGGLLAAIRKSDPASKRISTVDSGSTPMGVVSAVLALREQVAGGVGQYGFGDGASQPLPTPGAGATPSSTAGSG